MSIGVAANREDNGGKLDYADTRSRASTLALVVASRVALPWLRTTRRHGSHLGRGDLTHGNEAHRDATQPEKLKHSRQAVEWPNLLQC